MKTAFSAQQLLEELGRDVPSNGSCEREAIRLLLLLEHYGLISALDGERLGEGVSRSA